MASRVWFTVGNAFEFQFLLFVFRIGKLKVSGKVTTLLLVYRCWMNIWDFSNMWSRTQRQLLEPCHGKFCLSSVKNLRVENWAKFEFKS
jgi:hypothetical protein